MSGKTSQELLNEKMKSVTKAIHKIVKAHTKGRDELKDGSDIYDWPLEVIDQRGREYAVVISTGGPHIEVAADGLQRARLEGYWWSTRATLHNDIYDQFLDIYIEREDY